MAEVVVAIAGQKVRPDVALIRKLLADNPTWGRTRLSVELCERWKWRAPNGQLKDMACRTVLLQLEQAEHIVLPLRQSRSDFHRVTNPGRASIVENHSGVRFSLAWMVE